MCALALNGMDGNPFTYKDVDASPNGIVFAQGRLGVSGNYPTGGDTVDFTTLGDWVPGTAVLSLVIQNQSGNLAQQYVPIGNLATALNAWKLKWNNNSAFSTEHANGAYSGTDLTDIITWQATFRKLL